MTKRLLLRAPAQWGQLGLAAVLLLLCITLGEQAKPLLIKNLLDEHAMKGDRSGRPGLGGLVTWPASCGSSACRLGRPSRPGAWART